MYFMMATALSVITSTMILRLHYRGLDKEPSRWLRVLVFDLMAPLLCLRSVSKWAKHHRSQAAVPITNGLRHSDDGFQSNVIANISHGNNIEMSPLKRTATEPRCRSFQDRQNRYLLEKNGNKASNYKSISTPEPKEQTLESHRLEWQKVAEVLDRFFFWIFLIFILIPLVSLVGFVRVFSGNF